MCVQGSPEHPFPVRYGVWALKFPFVVKKKLISPQPNIGMSGFENLRAPSLSSLTSHPGMSFPRWKVFKVAGVSLLSLSPEGKVRPTVMRDVDSPQGTAGVRLSPRRSPCGLVPGANGTKCHKRSS